MAVCPHCDGEMTEKISCKPDAITISGGLFEPIRWGEGGASKAWVIDFCCRDCFTPPGGVHHPGCCVERCPACLGQALGCPCFDDVVNDDGDEAFTELPIDTRPGRHQMRCRAHRVRRHYRR